MKKIFILLIICISVATTNATVYYVNRDRPNNTGAGTSWATAKKDLQNAINIAASGDEIWVRTGVYTPTQDLNGSLTPLNPRDKAFYLKDKVKVYGGFKGTETLLWQRNWTSYLTILSGEIGDIYTVDDNCYHVAVTIADNATTWLDGFTIENNFNKYADAGTMTSPEGSIYRNEGGAMICLRSNFTIKNCIIQNNKSYIGAGMHVYYNSNPTIANCIFTKNKSDRYFAAGLLITTYCSVNITNSSFVNNSGGGLGIVYSTMTANDCLFEDNTANYGSGIYLYNHAKVTIDRSIIYNNKAKIEGAGIYNGGYSDLQISNSLIEQNTAYQLGGGISTTGSSFTKMVNCTVNYNSTTQEGVGKGGGLYFDDNSTGGIYNSILFKSWDYNEACSYRHDIYCANTGSPVQVFNSMLFEYDAIYTLNVILGSGCLVGYPDFIDYGNPKGPDDQWRTIDDGNILAPTSLCINAGNNTYTYGSYDLKYDPRVVFAKTDMGAYESKYKSPVYGLTSISGHLLTTQNNPDEVQSRGLENEGSTQIEIYPNPGASVINIRVSDMLKGSMIRVFDGSGRSISSIRMAAGQDNTQLLKSDFPAGAYILVFEDGTSKKIIFQ